MMSRGKWFAPGIELGDISDKEESKKYDDGHNNGLETTDINGADHKRDKGL